MRSQWKAKSADPRYCEHCTTILERRRHQSGRLEGFRDFMRRRFCSLSCANSRSKGGQSRKASHYHARKMRGLECECCGTTKRLHAHHVNEDWTDNRIENIQTLCIFCHQFWHATHRRLGVTPTQPMPRLVSQLGGTAKPAWDDCAVTAMQSLPKSRKPSSKA